MPSVGPISPGTLANVSFGTAPWSNPSNAGSSNDSYATAELVSTQSDYLQATNFNFAAIPDSAAIVGVKVEVEAKATVNNGIGEPTFSRAQLVIGGVVNTDYLPLVPDYLDDSDTVYEFGGSGENGTSDRWHLDLSVAQVKDSGFGFAMAITNQGGTTEISVDHIRMTVYYTEDGEDGLFYLESLGSFVPGIEAVEEFCPGLEQVQAGESL